MKVIGTAQGGNADPETIRRPSRRHARRLPPMGYVAQVLPTTVESTQSRWANDCCARPPVARGGSQCFEPIRQFAKLPGTRSGCQGGKGEAGQGPGGARHLDRIGPRRCGSRPSMFARTSRARWLASRHSPDRSQPGSTRWPAGRRPEAAVTILATVEPGPGRVRIAFGARERGGGPPASRGRPRRDRGPLQGGSGRQRAAAVDQLAIS